MSSIRAGDEKQGGLENAAETAPGPAHQHAPTLLTASDRAAGEVRVWAPSVWELRSGVVVGLAGVVCIVGMGSVAYSDGTMKIFSGLFGAAQILLGADLGFGVLLTAVAILTACLALRRPKYLTTDGHGIALTTRKSSRALRWDEILAVSLIGPYLTIRTEQGRLTAYLAGYIKPVRKELFSTIAHRADLYRRGPCSCVRTSRLGSRSLSQPQLPPAPCVRSERSSILWFAGSCLAAAFLLAFSGVCGLIISRLDRVVRAETWWPSGYTFRTHTPGPVMAEIDREVGRFKHPPTQARLRQLKNHLLTVRLFVAQRPGDPELALTVPGGHVYGEYIHWAPTFFQNARAPVYEYVLSVFQLAARHSPDRVIRVRIDYAHRHRWVTATLSRSPRLGAGTANSVRLYSNNWGDSPAKETQTGRLVGSLPPLGQWSYAGTAVDASRGKPCAFDFTFYPVPAEKRQFVNGKDASTASAAWLPGTIPASGAWCCIHFSNGMIRRVRLDRPAGPGPFTEALHIPNGPARVRIQWGLTPRELRSLPAGRI